MFRLLLIISVALAVIVGFSKLTNGNVPEDAAIDAANAGSDGVEEPANETSVEANTDAISADETDVTTAAEDGLAEGEETTDMLDIAVDELLEATETATEEAAEELGEAASGAVEAVADEVPDAVETVEEAAAEAIPAE